MAKCEVCGDPALANSSLCRTCWQDWWCGLVTAAKASAPAIALPSFANAHACGDDGCRVCFALGVLKRPLRPHHPLKTEAALARAEEIHAFMLEYQAKNGKPPTARKIGDELGISSAGLVTEYLKRLGERGRARELGRKGMYARWEAIA